MNKILALILCCLLLTGCGAVPAAPPSNPQAPEPTSAETPEEPQVLFIYNGKEYDLREREPSVNALIEETQVGNFLVVEGHINPKIAYYGIFDTETKTFVKDILGTNLTWRDDDITTAVYDVWSESGIYDYGGRLLAELDLQESEYIYRLAWSDSRHLSVEINSDSSESPRLVEWEIPPS